MYVHSLVCCTLADEATCSRVGRDLVQEGGSLVDGAIGSMLCLGVINSMASGIGGGGYMVVVNAETGLQEVIDFRDRAPASAFPLMYESSTNGSFWGGTSVAVPGEIHGMWTAWNRHGKLQWRDLVRGRLVLEDRGITSVLAGIIVFSFPVTRVCFSFLCLIASSRLFYFLMLTGGLIDGCPVCVCVLPVALCLLRLTSLVVHETPLQFLPAIKLARDGFTVTHYLAQGVKVCMCVCLYLYLYVSVFVIVCVYFSLFVYLCM